MKAITTKYMPPTNFRGSRYKASDGDGNSVTIGADDALNYDQLHQSAARALCAKMGWQGEMVGGWCGHVMVWCWVKSHDRFAYSAKPQVAPVTCCATISSHGGRDESPCGNESDQICTRCGRGVCEAHEELLAIEIESEDETHGLCEDCRAATPEVL